jgi:hypothetical protein
MATELSLVLKVRSKLDARARYLVFFGVPDERFGNLDAANASSNFVIGNRTNNEGNEAVLTVVSQELRV